ncbi:DUF397 domain-containing protein [Saccharopolyspora gregorii]
MEVGTAPGVVAVRDSKAPRHGVLSFSPHRWRAFLRSLR